VSTTWEDAKLCPKCGLPGEATGKTTSVPGKPGAKLHYVECRSVTCPWYKTTWLVQVDADGTIPEPKDHSREPKLYQGFEDHNKIANDIREALERQSVQETLGGAEVPRPR
jgi:hypothetical protein